MPDEGRVVTAVDWRSVLPFTHVFRAFRVAIHPSKMILSLIALLLIYTGGRIMDAAWMDKYKHGDIPRYSVELPSTYGDPYTSAADLKGPFSVFMEHQIASVEGVVRNVLTADLHGIIESLAQFVLGGPAWLCSTHPLFAAIFGFWMLLVVSLFGGAIARIAAVHVGRDEKPSIRQALRFSSGKILSLLFAPLIPLLIIGGTGLIVAVGGLLLLIPQAGPIAVSVLFPLTLLVGFVASLVIIGSLAGFSLMYPTVAVEGSDSFDAISRSFSYVFARPWRLALYSLVAVIYGALTYFFLHAFVWLMLAFVHYAERAFLSDTSHAEHIWGAVWPGPEFWELTYSVNYSALSVPQKIAAGILSFWVYMVVSLLGAYIISFYFSASTIIYYLMRHEVDATELDEVYIEHSDDELTDALEDAKPATDPATTVTPT